MKFEDFKGMPSGGDYGTVLKWTLLDGGDFVVAFFAQGNPFEPETSKFTWVVETKTGETVYLSHHNPIHNPIFGLDEMEWQEFKGEVLTVVDKYLEQN